MPGSLRRSRIAPLALERFCLLADASGISLADGSSTWQRSFHEHGMEADPTTTHARAGAALANPDAVQLGATGRHDAFFPRSCESQRSPLSRSVGRGRGDSRTAWLPAALA